MILRSMTMKEVLISALEQIGMAWWVEVITDAPSCTYYFGPFLTSSEASSHQSGYLEDLKTEGAQDIKVEMKRCKPQQLTFCNLETT